MSEACLNSSKNAEICSEAPLAGGLSGGAVPTIMTFASGLYEHIGLAASITLATATLAVGVWLVIGIIQLKEIVSPNEIPTPLLDIFKKAEKYGWDFKVDGGLQILDFVRAIKQSGFDGELVFKGCAKTSLPESMNRQELFRNISKDHLTPQIL